MDKGIYRCADSRKETLKSARKVADFTGIHETLIGKFLGKSDGWIANDTFDRLCKLKEFKKLSASSSGTADNSMTDNEKILLKLFRRLPSDAQKEKLLELMRLVNL